MNQSRHQCSFQRRASLITWVVISLLLHAPAPQQCIAADDSTNVAMQGFFRSDPDASSCLISKSGGRWISKVGGQVRIADLDIGNSVLSLSLPVFVEVYDFTPRNLFAWQLMRGNFGASLHWQMRDEVPVPFIDAISPSVTLGYHHESDHYIDREFEHAFLDPRSLDFDNSTFSSYEYLRMAGNIRFTLIPGIMSSDIFLGIRWFPPPFATGQRQLKHGFSTGLQIQSAKIYEIALYLSAYFEELSTGFMVTNTPFETRYGQSTLLYRSVEFGGTYDSALGVQCNPYIAYSHSNGRGIDFLARYEEWSWGFRVSL